MAALASDVVRADTEARGVMGDRVESFVASVAETLGGDEQRAILAVLTDPQPSDAILKAVREGLSVLQSVQDP